MEHELFEYLERAAAFYDYAPTGQYDFQAAYALRYMARQMAMDAKAAALYSARDNAYDHYCNTKLVHLIALGM